MDAEVAIDAQFLLPILKPFFFGVLLQNDHLGQLGDGFIRPSPSDAFDAPADLPKDPLQKRRCLWSDHAGLQPDLDMGKKALRKAVQI